MNKSLLAVVVYALSVQAQIFYVVNGLDESLGWANLQTQQSNAHAATLGNVPNDVFVVEEALYVVNSGFNSIQMIERAQLGTFFDVEVSGAVNPWAVVELSRCCKLAVTGYGSGTLSIIDINSQTVDTTFVTGVAPQAVAATWEAIYVLNTGVSFPEFGDGLLKLYDPTTYALLDSVVVGVNPQAMEFIGDEIHVLCTGNYDDESGAAYIVTADSLEVDTILEIGGSPGAISANGHDVFLAAGGWAGEGNVYRYDALTRQIINSPDNPLICGEGATDIIAMPGGQFAVTCFSAASLEIREANGVLVNRFDMSAGAGALGVWWGTSDADEVLPEITQDMNILSAYPNPFNGDVMLEWTGQLRTPNAIKIFDVLGRTVGELSVGEGVTRVGWAPGARGGQEVAAGVYFARFVNGPAGRPIRIIYVK